MYILEWQVPSFQGASMFLSTSECYVEWTQSQGHALWMKDHVHSTIKCSMPSPCLPMSALEEGLQVLRNFGECGLRNGAAAAVEAAGAGKVNSQVT